MQLHQSIDDISLALLKFQQALKSAQPALPQDLLCSGAGLRRAASAKTVFSGVRLDSSKYKAAQYNPSGQMLRSKVRRLVSSKLARQESFEHKRIAKSIRMTESIYKEKAEKAVEIRLQDSLALYYAKCVDYEKEYSEMQALNFVEKMNKAVANKALNLAESGLGVNAAAVLKKVIKTSGRFNSLNLEKNIIKDEGAKHIAEAIAYSTSLINVSLASNGICGNGIAKLFNALCKNESIISFDVSSKEGLNRNKVSFQSALVIGYCLAQNRVLQKLVLANVGMTMMSLECLVKQCSGSSSLIWLDLSRNDLGPKAGLVLKGLLKKIGLQYLNISQTNLQDDGLDYFAEYFQQIIKYNNEEKITLTTLILEGNKLTLGRVLRFLSGLKRKTTLRKLYMSENDFKQKAVNTLQKMMECESIEEVHLRNSQIQAYGANMLGAGLSKGSQLARLILSSNKLGDGVVSVARGIAFCKSLVFLDISYCNIQDQQFIAVARELRTNYFLKTLLAKENFVREQGGQQILQTLYSNKTMLKLDLTRNFISIQTMEAIEAQLESNCETRRILLLPDEASQRRRFEDQRREIDEKSFRLKEQKRCLLADIERLTQRADEFKKSSTMQLLQAGRKAVLSEWEEQLKVLETTVQREEQALSRLRLQLKELRAELE